jgi:Na+-driven multidrug efflux pump
VLSIVLGLGLVSWLGLQGAAWATLSIGLIDFALHWALVRRVLPGVRLVRPPRPQPVPQAQLSQPPNPRR